MRLFGAKGEQVLWTIIRSYYSGSKHSFRCFITWGQKPARELSNIGFLFSFLRALLKTAEEIGFDTAGFTRLTNFFKLLRAL